MTIERRNVGPRLSDLVIYAPPPTYYEPMYPRYERYDRYPSSPSVNINIPLR